MVHTPDDLGNSYLAKKSLADTTLDVFARHWLGRLATMVKQDVCETELGRTEVFSWAVLASPTKPTAHQVFTRGTRYLAAPAPGCWPYGWATFAPKEQLELWSVHEILGVKSHDRVFTLWQLGSRAIQQTPAYIKHNGDKSGSDRRDIMLRDPRILTWQIRAESGKELLLVYLSVRSDAEPDRSQIEIVGLWNVVDETPPQLQEIRVREPSVSLQGFDLQVGVSRWGGPPALLYEANYTLGALIPNDDGYGHDDRLVLYPIDLATGSYPTVAGHQPSASPLK